FDQKQIEADLKRILDLGFFDKTEAKVLTQRGPREGVNIIFHVKELPVIRDIQFEGLKSVQQSDVLKAFRENRIGVSKEAVFDPVKVKNATRVIKELLSARGHPNAKIEDRKEEVSSSSLALTFVVDEGDRVRVDEIKFTGNEHFKEGQLRNSMKYVKETGLIPRFKSSDILDREKLEQDLHLVGNFMRAKGYLQARTGEPKIESLGEKTTGFFIPLPLLSSKDEALRVTVPVVEGRLYKIGEIKVEGNSIYSEEIIKRVIGLNKGDVADGERISKALYENLKSLYGQAGFIQYTAEPEPDFKDDPQNPTEGIVDFKINIEEGKQFTLRRLEFAGNTFTRDYVLRRAVLVNEGDVYDQRTFEYSVLSLNQLGYFNPIDKDKDVDRRTDDDQGLVDVTLKVTERGKQEISFNGGVSGVSGSFFGLTYSTNNLLGRGESLSFSGAVGNRQRSLTFSFTEPYLRNRPITAGFSLFTSSLQFFGPGTQLSQNINALQGIFGTTTDFLNTNSENLFTQTQAG
ncbi:MAG: BamA/OMP85 family outer membrane protein, partial [Pyrinomonadaceae bacterium]